MALCDFCGTRILFGGLKRGDLRFCSPKCSEKGLLVESSVKVPDAEVERRVREVHQGNCPKCGGPGPVDVHTSHLVYSALAFTRWSSHPEVCCLSCGRKKNLKHGLCSLLFGWWGFPFGLVITPVQVGRSLAYLLGMGVPDPSTPSPALQKVTRLNLAAGQFAKSATPGSVPQSSRSA